MDDKAIEKFFKAEAKVKGSLTPKIKEGDMAEKLAKSLAADHKDDKDV